MHTLEEERLYTPRDAVPPALSTQSAEKIEAMAEANAELCKENADLRQMVGRLQDMLLKTPAPLREPAAGGPGSSPARLRRRTIAAPGRAAALGPEPIAEGYPSLPTTPPGGFAGADNGMVIGDAPEAQRWSRPSGTAQMDCAADWRASRPSETPRIDCALDDGDGLRPARPSATPRIDCCVAGESGLRSTRRSTTPQIDCSGPGPDESQAESAMEWPKPLGPPPQRQPRMLNQKENSVSPRMSPRMASHGVPALGSAKSPRSHQPQRQADGRTYDECRSDVDPAGTASTTASSMATQRAPAPTWQRPKSPMQVGRKGDTMCFLNSCAVM